MNWAPGVTMRKLIFLVFLTSTTASYGADLDGSLAISSVNSPEIRVDASISNHSARDYCFFQSLNVPSLFAANARPLPARFAFEPGGPVFSNEDGYVAIWTRPNNEQVIWRGTNTVFRYTLDLISKVDSTQLRQATLDIDAYDCVALHTHPWVYPANAAVKHISLHFSGGLPTEATSALSQP